MAARHALGVALTVAMMVAGCARPATMVADPAHGQVLLIRSGPIANDQTWIWGGATWTEAASTP